MSEKPLVALAGSPNSGKTALFNSLTGTHQKTANYPGVTVEKKEGFFKTPRGQEIRILDLPGTYSLDAKSPDEELTRDILFRKSGEEFSPELLVAVVDATSLERGLSFVLELKELGKPFVLALNMMDIAKNRGLDLDLNVLSRELDAPVVPTIATEKAGVKSLESVIEETLGKTTAGRNSLGSVSGGADAIRKRFAEVDRLLKLATKQEVSRSVWTERLDQIVLHPVWGSIVLIATLAIIFQAVFSWAEPGMDLIDGFIGALSSWIDTSMSDGALKSLIIDGMIAGVGSVIIFLPQILILFLFVLLLEDIGYMARAAFLMDNVMGKVGLHGRAFVPLLSSFACAIPGIMAARTIESPKDRLSTIMVAPLMTCSARLPVYTLLIAAFIPNDTVAGFFGLQGLVMLGLYVAGVLAAIGVAFVLKRTALKGETPPFILELPSYKFPNWRNLVFGLSERAKVFLKRAGTIIFSLSVILWFLASYPKDADQRAAAIGQPAIYESYAGQIGRSIEPLLAPIGFDWRISVALIPGFAAREVMVGALGTVYAVEDAPEGVDEDAHMESSLSTLLARDFTLATAFSLLAWYIFAPQCLSTIAITRRETNSWRWPIFMLVYLTLLAWVASYIVYQLTLALGG